MSVRSPILSSHIRVLTTAQRSEWMEVLERSLRYDYFHLPSYHAMTELNGGGRARFFVYERDGFLIAMPLLLRPLDEVAFLGTAAPGWHDATSVYGYAGPVGSSAAPAPAILADFQSTLRAVLLQQKVVSAFSRLNPLLGYDMLLQGLGGSPELGQTVSIDLTVPEQEQKNHYRLNHRRGIGKLLRMGMRCVRDETLECLADFAAIYEQTMSRVEAASSYRHDLAYFRKLYCCEPDAAHLFVVHFEGRVIAGLFVLENRGLVHCHFGGTLNEYLKYSPMKLLFDTVRQWACARGFQRLHLGGGVGSRNDSLFHFKAGFSNLRHSFQCWRWIVCPEMYKKLCYRTVAHRRSHGEQAASTRFFPFYRQDTMLLAS